MELREKVNLIKRNVGQMTRVMRKTQITQKTQRMTTKTLIQTQTKAKKKERELSFKSSIEDLTIS